MTVAETVTLRAPEVRTYDALQVREMEATESGRFLEGRAVPYGVFADIGWFLEQHEAGSFARSITEAAERLPLLMWHDSRTWPVGVSHEWRDTEDGLGVVWRMDDSDEAARAVDLADKGMLTGLSIGFAPIRSKWEQADDWDPDLGPNHKDRVTRQESRLLEVSLTPTPAFAGAQVSLVRSRDQRKASQQRSEELRAWQEYRESIRRKDS